jgi:hypothetical protein
MAGLAIAEARRIFCPLPRVRRFYAAHQWAHPLFIKQGGLLFWDASFPNNNLDGAKRCIRFDYKDAK